MDLNFRRRFRAAAAVLITLATHASCGTTVRDEAPPPLTEAERVRATDLGMRAAGVLQTTLAPRLMEAMQAGGPAEAMRFCSIAADSLTASASQVAELEVKRTSSRIRNPDNAPDEWEAEALARFEASVASGDSLPSGWLQAVSGDEMRFYSPLVITPLCVDCHGGPEDLAPGVRELLDQRYPNDRAIGYRPGDLRGLIRVSIQRN